MQRQVDHMTKETEEIQKTDIGESPDAQVRPNCDLHSAT